MTKKKLVEELKKLKGNCYVTKPITHYSKDVELGFNSAIDCAIKLLKNNGPKNKSVNR